MSESGGVSVALDPSDPDYFLSQVEVGPPGQTYYQADSTESLFYSGFRESTPEEIALDKYVERTRTMFALDDEPTSGGPGYYEEPPSPPLSIPPLSPPPPAKKMPGFGSALFGLALGVLIIHLAR